MKRQVAILDATPSKRIYSSLVADYGLRNGLCELVDNAIDTWARRGRKQPLEIAVELDLSQQRVQIQDNAGGIDREELKTIVAPGITGNDPMGQSIGYFGVGSKRAMVALAQQTRVVSRTTGPVHSVEIDDQWLEHDEGWNLPVYEVDDQIPAGNTSIEMVRLRLALLEDTADHVRTHFEHTYGRFIQANGLTLKLNGTAVTPRFFHNWAFPPGHLPQTYEGDVAVGDAKVHVVITAGLSLESSPATGDYGVYFYCNDRLVVSGKKDYYVGFSAGVAGVPHPGASLIKCIVHLTGPARLMPWNSSKSDINPSHPTYQAIRPLVVDLVAHFASLSRRLSGKWEDEVFAHKTGEIQHTAVEEITSQVRASLAPLPKTRKKFEEKLREANAEAIENKPWTRGLLEALAAVELLGRQHFQQVGRIQLILLDSTLEIAYKEYLVNESGERFDEQKLAALFRNRVDVTAKVRGKLDPEAKMAPLWQKADYYYKMRCDLIHKTAAGTVSSTDIDGYRGLVEQLLAAMFGLKTRDT